MGSLQNGGFREALYDVTLAVRRRCFQSSIVRTVIVVSHFIGVAAFSAVLVVDLASWWWRYTRDATRTNTTTHVSSVQNATQPFEQNTEFIGRKLFNLVKRDLVDEDVIDQQQYGVMILVKIGRTARSDVMSTYQIFI